MTSRRASVAGRASKTQTPTGHLGAFGQSQAACELRRMLNPLIARLAGYLFDRLRALLDGLPPSPGLRPLVLSVGEPRHPPPSMVAEALAARAADWGGTHRSMVRPSFAAPSSIGSTATRLPGPCRSGAERAAGRRHPRSAVPGGADRRAAREARTYAGGVDPEPFYQFTSPPPYSAESRPISTPRTPRSFVASWLPWTRRCCGARRCCTCARLRTRKDRWPVSKC